PEAAPVTRATLSAKRRMLESSFGSFSHVRPRCRIRGGSLRAARGARLIRAVGGADRDGATTTRRRAPRAARADSSLIAPRGEDRPRFESGAERLSRAAILCDDVAEDDLAPGERNRWDAVRARPRHPSRSPRR